MDDNFNYMGLEVHYSVRNNIYYLDEINYYIAVGHLILEEGPGWIWVAAQGPHLTFLDSTMAAAIAEMLNALNAELPK